MQVRRLPALRPYSGIEEEPPVERPPRCLSHVRIRWRILVGVDDGAGAIGLTTYATPAIDGHLQRAVPVMPSFRVPRFSRIRLCATVTGTNAAEPANQRRDSEA